MSHKDCNCWECQLEKKYGGLDKVPEEAVLEHGGCPYCAMTGFEDYPTSKKPCRLGHMRVPSRLGLWR